MKKDLHTDDEFEPIELGSVSEETKGINDAPSEGVGFNSQEL